MSYNLKILNYKIQLSEYKFYNSKNLFKSFYVEIALCLNNYLRLLVTLDYVLIKTSINLDFAKNNVLEYKEFILLIIKMLLYYLWDFENIGKNLDNCNFSNLIISEISTINELEYIFANNEILLSKIKQCNSSNNQLFDIQSNVTFYKQFYLYAKIVNSYDLNNNIVMPLEILNFENFKNIEHYSIKFINQLLIINAIYGIDIEFCCANEMDLSIEQEILSELQNYKFNFIEEWKASKKVSVECANLQRLKILNEYVDSKLKVK